MNDKIFRITAFIYGSIAYIYFLITLIYLIGFVGDFLVPKTIDSGQPSSALSAMSIDILLLTLFGLQHSVMARFGFKQWLTKMFPPAIERSTYVLMSSAALSLLFWQWRPIGGIIWNFENIAAKYLIDGLFVSGWLVVISSTFVIDHFDLFGVRQVYLYLRDREYEDLEFKTIGIYRYIRHPLMLGFAIAFWATPRMSGSHLLFAIGMSVYILIGIFWEERDLVDTYGESYRQYQQQVPMLFPRPKKH